jgi:hypothetical protein
MSCSFRLDLIHGILLTRFQNVRLIWLVKWGKLPYIGNITKDMSRIYIE